MTKYYKAFDRNLTCNKFQFEIGKEYVHDGEIVMYQSGFHCCENILNCLCYYPADSRFCEVEIGDEFITDNDKIVTSKIKIVREIIGDELDELLTGTLNYEYSKYTYLNGSLHSKDDKPSIDRMGWRREWHCLGRLHRAGDKPARVLSDGHQEWWVNGQLHRETKDFKGNIKPAVIYPDGRMEWWVNGEFIRNSDYYKLNKVWYVMTISFMAALAYFKPKYN